MTISSGLVTVIGSLLDDPFAPRPALDDAIPDFEAFPAPTEARQQSPVKTVHFDDGVSSPPPGKAKRKKRKGVVADDLAAAETERTANDDDDASSEEELPADLSAPAPKKRKR